MKNKYPTASERKEWATRKFVDDEKQRLWEEFDIWLQDNYTEGELVSMNPRVVGGLWQTFYKKNKNNQ
jgi:hypothetical protein